MKLLLLILSMIFISCESGPKFKTGMYVKHVQSGCIGRVEMAMKYRDEALLGAYVCEVILEGDSRLMKEPVTTVDYSLLEIAENKDIQKYKNALAVFAKKAEEQKK